MKCVKTVFALFGCVWLCALCPQMISHADQVEPGIVKEFAIEPTANPSPTVAPEISEEPAIVKDEKTLKADIKAKKKEIDQVRKESKAVSKEIKTQKKRYEDILKKMQKDSSSVSITIEDLSSASQKVAQNETNYTSIESSQLQVKAENRTYSSLYRAKDYQGALDTYERILTLEKQILSDYNAIQIRYVEILAYFEA